MSSVHWIALFVCVAVLAGATIRIRRGETPRLSDEPTGWPWGSIAWHACVRCLPSILVAGITVLVVTAVGASFPERADGPFARPVAVAVPLLATLALSFLLVLCVALFNRPRFLVSRDLRQEPGAAAELLARRERRRSGP